MPHRPYYVHSSTPHHGKSKCGERISYLGAPNSLRSAVKERERERSAGADRSNGRARRHGEQGEKETRRQGDKEMSLRLRRQLPVARHTDRTDRTDTPAALGSQGESCCGSARPPPLRPSLVVSYCPAMLALPPIVDGRAGLAHFFRPCRSIPRDTHPLGQTTWCATGWAVLVRRPDVLIRE